ncbi:carbon-nitrogen hydrolase family protein [Sulfurimonas sp. HSL-1716]|uniref:carbon-nitrogen hydrolase family protein n=1 Tax=Hydrocurvibacter sulfurireducens TaxID=3131937 RepID=UPI0031F74AC5
MRSLCSLSFKTISDYEENLKTLIRLIEETPQDALVVAPEVCLTGFDYENFDKVVEFASHAADEIKKVSKKRIVILTIIEKIDGEVYNMAKIFHNGEVVYQRGKARLFRYGGEHNYFAEDSDEKVEIVEVDGLKLGVLICFELRYKELWKKLEGADIIATPSWWGVLRTEHFKVITQGLAIINQCYVVASDSANEDCTKLSGIITPFGEDKRNGSAACLKIDYDKKEVRAMRRYLDVGIG